ncbi:helix-turn-helix domain-containing protein [Pediococcus argentinicus]|uniref:TetR/AcrR family transcriptional regulator n=1 Tax=Pediococcus argentinicus TaxID=480391 RepID=UPI00338F07AD
MQRKRGEKLEQAIFDAALKLFDEQGIDAVTFQNVAELAQTSRGVLYRRWKTPGELLFDAVHHHIHQNSGIQINEDYHDFPDTGSLKTDLQEHAKRGQKLLDSMNKYFVKFSIYQIVNNSDILSSDATEEMEESSMRLGNIIAERAIKRGEIKHAPSKEVLLLLGNLRRYYTFIVPNDDPDMNKIIDDIVLPAWLATGNKPE